jgi:hypothetical protein
MAPKARILKRGTYDLGGPGLVNGPSFLGSAGVNGRIAQNDISMLGAYDLRPWQGQPVQGGTDDYRPAVTPVESGAARVRFSPLMAAGAAAGPPIGPELRSPLQRSQGGLGETFGAKTESAQGVFANVNNALANSGAFVGLSLWVAAFDWPQLQSMWNTSNGTPGVATQPNNWNWFDRSMLFAPPDRPAFWNGITSGPEILSGLAGSPSITYDLEALGGGCRFVALFLAGYGAGSMMSLANPIARIHYIIEDAPGPDQYGAITYGFPVRSIQTRAAPNLEDDPVLTVAQWSMQRMGGYNQIKGNGTHGQSSSVVVVNNNDFPLSATINYFVGPAHDPVASPGTPASITAVAAGVAGTQQAGLTRIPPDNGLPAGSVNGPYSYAHLQLVDQAGVTGTGGTQAIVFVTVS